MVEDNTDGLPYLNIAHTICATQALGPGLRAAVWVQGCHRSCESCISPHWQTPRPARLVEPVDLVDELLSNPLVDGFTFSGGEPMLQAAGLAKLILLARRKRHLSLICYTGFTLEQLEYKIVHESTSSSKAISDLLNEIDVLIDGPYVVAMNDNIGLRGSNNQQIHYLTKQLRGHDFVSTQRNVEIQVENDSVTIVGIPTKELLDKYASIFPLFHTKNGDEA